MAKAHAQTAIAIAPELQGGYAMLSIAHQGMGRPKAAAKSPTIRIGSAAGSEPAASDATTAI